jgi:hypothetical protein
MSGQLHALATLPPGKEFPVPIGVEKNLLPLLGIGPQPVAFCYTRCLSLFLRVIFFKAIVEVLSFDRF